MIAPKLLIVIGDLDVGGTERHIIEILPQLAQKGFQPIVYSLTHKGRLAPFLEATGIEVIQPPLARSIRRLPKRARVLLLAPITAGALWWLMRRQRPTIVHFFLPAAYLIGGLCSVASRVEARVMSRRSLNNYQRRYPILRWLEFWLHRNMTAVLGNSCAVVSQLAQEGVPADRLGLIYNGIDPSRFENALARNAARQALGIGTETLVITMIASLIPYKGHEDLLEAIAVVREELGDDWVLLCVGRDDGIGYSLQALANRLKIAKWVRWLGERDDVPAILCASDLCVLASREEGFSNTVLEGMAAGLPIVVTDAGGNKEAVLDGVTGIVVPARNRDALGHAIDRLASDPALRRQMGAAAKRRVQSEFHVSRCVSDYACLYRGLLKCDGTPVREILQSQRS